MPRSVLVDPKHRPGDDRIRSAAGSRNSTPHVHAKPSCVADQLAFWGERRFGSHNFPPGCAVWRLSGTSTANGV